MQSPDEQARFAAFYRARYAEVLGFIARRLGDSNDAGRHARAEDIVHETFLIAWRQWCRDP